jgi:hypothetical protein
LLTNNSIAGTQYGIKQQHWIPDPGCKHVSTQKATFHKQNPNQLTIHTCPIQKSKESHTKNQPNHQTRDKYSYSKEQFFLLKKKEKTSFSKDHLSSPPENPTGITYSTFL